MTENTECSGCGDHHDEWLVRAAGEDEWELVCGAPGLSAEDIAATFARDLDEGDRGVDNLLTGHLALHRGHLGVVEVRKGANGPITTWGVFPEHRMQFRAIPIDAFEDGIRAGTTRLWPFTSPSELFPTSESDRTREGVIWVDSEMWDDPRVQSLSHAAFRVFMALATASARSAAARATEVAEALPSVASVEEALTELEGAGLVTREGEALAVTCYAALREAPCAKREGDAPFTSHVDAPAN